MERSDAILRAAVHQLGGCKWGRLEVSNLKFCSAVAVVLISSWCSSACGDVDSVESFATDTELGGNSGSNSSGGSGDSNTMDTSVSTNGSSSEDSESEAETTVNSSEVDSSEVGSSDNESSCETTGDIEDLDQRLAEVLAMQEEPVLPLVPPEPVDSSLFALGEALFFDPILSGNKDIACATCHHPTLGSADGISLSLGTGALGLGPERPDGFHRNYVPRHAPVLFNIGDPAIVRLFWDGRVERLPDGTIRSPAGSQLPDEVNDVLSAQAMFPVLDRTEMRGIVGDLTIFGELNELAEFDDEDRPSIWAAIMRRLGGIQAYRDLFLEAYPEFEFEALSFVHAANAIAAYERQAFSFPNSPWDAYLRGDKFAISDEVKSAALKFYSNKFGQPGCSRCHSGSLFTDHQFHNTGIPQLGPGHPEAAPYDLGRAHVTGRAEDRFRFRTPSLRSFALAPPFMHNGSILDLAALTLHYHAPELTLDHYLPVEGLHSDFVETVQSDGDHIAEHRLTFSDKLPIVVGSIEMQDAFQFIEALHDPAIDSLSDLRPDSVPSGLKVP